MYQPILNKQPEIQLQKYIKKINNLIELLNDDNTTKEEKDYIMKELKKIENKIRSLKQSEEDFLKQTLKEEEELNKNKLIERYKIYIENKKLYYKIINEHIEIPELFKYLYDIYNNMNYNENDIIKLSNQTINNIKYDNITLQDKEELNKFIELFNKNYDKCNTDIFDIFLN